MATPMTLTAVTSGAAAPITTPTTFATAVSLVMRNEAAMATPHVFPSSCSPIFELNTGLKGLDRNYKAVVEETFLYVDAHANTFKTCQPPGPTTAYYEPYSNKNGQVKAYRKAVCPKG